MQIGVFRIVSRLVVPVWLSMLALAHIGSATAADLVTAQQARDVRAVVTAQLDALATEDAPRAFSYASPAIRKLFGDADTFMAMVRQSYPMVIHPSAVSYLVPQRQGPAVIQAVLLRDADGRQWMAVYDVRRQADGHWRIEGVVVRQEDSKSST